VDILVLEVDSLVLEVDSPHHILSVVDTQAVVVVGDRGQIVVDILAVDPLGCMVVAVPSRL
jgi:hypothetical protein